MRDSWNPPHYLPKDWGSPTCDTRPRFKIKLEICQISKCQFWRYVPKYSCIANAIPPCLRINLLFDDDNDDDAFVLRQRQHVHQRRVSLSTSTTTTTSTETVATGQTPSSTVDHQNCPQISYLSTYPVEYSMKLNNSVGLLREVISPSKDFGRFITTDVSLEPNELSYYGKKIMQKWEK